MPVGVEVNLEYSQITVKGPKGTLVQPLHPEVNVKMEDGTILVERLSPRKFHRSLHGTRAATGTDIQTSKPHLIAHFFSVVVLITTD